MKVHHYKRLFYLLLGLNVVIILLLFLLFQLITSGEDDVVRSPHSIQKEDGISFNIQTNKQDLNKVIKHHLEEQQTGNFDYQVTLTDDVEFIGRVPIFQETMEVQLIFEPFVLDNGDLELRQKNMSIGKFSLPPSLVLGFIHNSVSLPEGITVQPDDEKVYVSLKDLKLKSDFTIAVKEFNLKEDNILFSLHLPMN